MGELWNWNYRKGMAVDSDRRKAGVRAMKAELVLNGHGEGVVVDLPVWGDAAQARTFDFQRAHGLAADAVLGPATARALFRARKRSVAASLGIPDDLLCKQVSEESANDPVAEGVADPDDEGISQINLRSHPGVSQAQAWDPAFAVPWQGRYLLSLHRAAPDWDAALAAYNLGTALALKWLAAGKPLTGGPVIGHEPDGTPILGFAAAAGYVDRVRRSPC